jgi:raffinose/stachyose/melibiose transport system substrate-binding protein
VYYSYIVTDIFIKNKYFHLTMKNIFQSQLTKTIFITTLAILLIFMFWGCKKSTEPVVLTMASWRIEDVAQLNRINAQFTKSHPDITIEFQAQSTADYDTYLLAKLEAGTGADIMNIRPYDLGRSLYDGGYLATLNGEVTKMNQFTSQARSAWSTGDGKIYGVPQTGVTHGVYYQKSIFAKYGLGEPATWAEFVSACNVLLAGGEKVIAQGANDSWTLYETLFCGLGANFYGGETARQALMAGTKKMTDANFIRAFEMVLQLKKYLPSGFETLDYDGMRVLFASGGAAIFIGGSWEISKFEALGSGSPKIGFFVPPVVNSGDPLQYCFQLAEAFGMNSKTNHKKEVLEYLNWMNENEAIQVHMTELPGMFPLLPGSYTLTNPLSQKMWNATLTAGLTQRVVIEKLSATSPKGSTLMNEALTRILKGSFTPAQAAAYVQIGLDTWYHPGI